MSRHDIAQIIFVILMWVCGVVTGMGIEKAALSERMDGNGHARTRQD